MNKSAKELLKDKSVPIATKFNDYFVAKVVDWAIKNHVDEGRPANFKWDLEDKQVLTKIFENPKTSGINLPMRDSKFKHFVYSIIQNGLNTDDVNLFHRYKDRLPLRSLGLAYEANDFVMTKSRVESKANLSAGFYMLEIQLDPKAYSANIQIDCMASYSHDELRDEDESDIDQNTDIFKLRAKSSTMTKRLLWLSHDADIKIQIKSPRSDIQAESDVSYLRFARLTKNFFLSRLFKKIGKPYDINKHSKISDTVLSKYWEQYDSLFQPVSMMIQPGTNVSQFIRSRSVPSPDEQMQRILKLLSSR
jgi:hypothetical protein